MRERLRPRRGAGRSFAAHRGIVVKTRWLLPLLGLGMLGCLNAKARLQSGEDGEAKEQEVRTIGDITSVAYERTEVMGVGLVVGLNGTGGGAPPASAYRDMLENYLKKKG